MMQEKTKRYHDSLGGKVVKAAVVFALTIFGVWELVAGIQGTESGGQIERRGLHGRIVVRSAGRRLPQNASVQISRSRDNEARMRIREGLSKARRHAPSKAKRLSAACGGTRRESEVLAMYDISILSGGRKWQPTAGEPVRVDVELSEPVEVVADSSLGLVHLADDGKVEELAASRYGFVYSADGASVTAFWFMADGFSVYAITEGDDAKTESTPARRLYDFYSRDFDKTSPTYNEYVPRYFTTVEGNRTFRQIVTDGQKLVRPEVLPSPLGRTFMGWYLYDETKKGQAGWDDEGFCDTPFDFDSPVVFQPGETGEHEYQLRSRFDRVGYVIFHEQPVGGEWPITAVRRVVMEERSENEMTAEVKIDDVKVTYDDTQDDDGTEHANATPRMIFRGWSQTKVMPGAMKDIEGNPIKLEASPFVFRRVKDTEATPRHLFPVFVNINWLTFAAAATGEGATYIPPRFYYADEGTNSFPVPLRTGYTFDGWWTGPDEGVRVSNADGSLYTGADLSKWTGYVKDGRLLLTGNTTIYGRWKAGDTRYVVVVLKQNIHDDKDAADSAKTYDFYESYAISAKSESTATVADSYKKFATASATAKDFEGFYYRTCDAATTVKGDGTTVLNVYYDRYKVTYAFKSSRSSNASNQQTMTGLYGQRLADCGYEWPTSSAWVDKASTSGTTTTITYLDAFNAIDYPDISKNDTTHVITTPLYPNGKYGSARIVHVLQDIEGVYSEENAVTAYASDSTIGNFNFTDKFEGFAVCGYRKGSFAASPDVAVADKQSESINASVLYVYHERKQFTLSFLDSKNGSVFDEVKVYYGAPLSSVTPPASPRPTDLTMAKGWSFTGWFNDRNTASRFNFDTTMPMANLRAYAGWETEWYLIQIDPNGGQLADGQSLWFWEAYNGDPIEEYSTVTRSFVEARDGKWFYAVQDRKYHGYTDEWVSGESPDRSAYYTTDISDPAIVPGRRYAQAVNAYRYAGWYEVTKDASGNEVENLYAFGQPVQTNTLLRLHWKHIGTYRLHYEAGEGTISDGDENETILRSLDGGIYADESEVLVTRTAVPPEGSAFLGWRIRGGDGTLLHPGHAFLFSSAYTMPSLDADGNRIEQLVLDAVYDKVMTVSLTTDANGGVIDGAVATTLPLAYSNAPTLITNITDTTRTVSGMRNNAYGHLSDGAGYYCIVRDDDGSEMSLKFLGWNTKADGTGTHFDGGQYVGVDTLDTPDGGGKNVLYAEWGVPVYFDKNNDDLGWSHDKWAEKWGDRFVYDEARDQYREIAILNGYATYPEIVRDSSTDSKMFAHWSTVRFKEWDKCPAFEFDTTPITKPTTLYAIWRDFIEVPFHVVDASGETIVRRDDWLEKAVLRVGNDTDVSFTGAPDGYVNVPEGEDWIWAFTCLGDSEGNVSEDRRITRLYFNPERDQRCVWVEYADGTAAAMPSDMTVHIVYYRNPKTAAVGYRELGADGLVDLDAVVSAVAPRSALIGLDGYDMTADVKSPMGYLPDASAYKHYAYAIGDTGAEGPSQLRFITEAKDGDGDRPALQIRNTWRGLQYSTDSGESWISYGYDAQLYVLYFTSQPTIVTLREQTVGTEADASEKFEYEIVVSNVVTMVTQTQTSTKEGRTQSVSSWSWIGTSYDEAVKTSDGATYYVNSKTWSWANSSSSYSSASADSSAGEPLAATLQDGGVDTVTLLTDVVSTPNAQWSEKVTAVVGDRVSWSSQNKQVTLTNTRTRTVAVTNAQTVVIVQKPKAGFTTSNDSGDGKFTFACASGAKASSRSVIYTNTREKETVELHVAVSQGRSIDHDDNNWRTETEADWTVDIPLSAGGVFTVTEDDLLAHNGVGAGGLLKTAPNGKVFAGVFYGRPDETNKDDENRVVLGGRVTSIGFVKPAGAKFYSLYLNNDTTLPVGENRLYYVYVTMPKAYFMKEGANGALTEIETLTYDGNAVGGMGFGAVTAQGMEVEAGEKAIAVASSGAGVFRVPVALDGARAASRNLVGIAIAETGADNAAKMTATAPAGGSIFLKVDNAQLKWSLDGESWSLFPGEPAVYAVYKETGCDLTIMMTSLAAPEDRRRDLFVVKVASDNLKGAGAFEISGYECETISPVDGVFTLAVTGGCSVTIHALQDNALSYDISETLPEGYAMRKVTINGAAPVSQMQVENGAVTFLNVEKTVEFTNVKSYTVEFLGEDGKTVLAEATDYDYGTAAADLAKPFEPAKARDAGTLYRFAGWGVEIGDVVSNAVYQARFRAMAVPQAVQRQTGGSLFVGLDEEPLLATMKTLGFDMTAADYSEPDATAYLNETEANGLRRWENLVTGTAGNRRLLATAAGRDGRALAVSLASAGTADVTDLGYIVLHELYKSTGGAWTRVAGPAEGIDSVFDLVLLGADGKSADATGYYRLKTLLVPKCDLSVTNEIESANTVGVLEVDSRMEHTMTAVPFARFDSDDGEDPAGEGIPVANYVVDGHLKDGDIIRIGARGVYEAWLFETATKGKAASYVPFTTIMRDGTAKRAPDAGTEQLTRNGAAWVTRGDVSAPFFLVGQHVGESVEVSVAGCNPGESGRAAFGCTMVPNPDIRPLAINDIDWGTNPGADDQIEIPSDTPGGGSLVLFWNAAKGSWGRSVSTFDRKTFRFTTTWVDSYSVGAGRGFWYYRAKGGAFSVVVKQKEDLR